MTTTLAYHALGTTSDFGIASIGGVDAPVLAFDALGADQSVQILPEADAPITEWALAMDLYIPSASAGSYTGLIQTGTGDADLFLKAAGDTAGIGISSIYEGAVPFDEWVRIAMTVTIEDGDTVLRKFVNGELVGTQNLGVTDRWAIDPDLGLRLFTDNDGETSAGYVSSIFFAANPPEAETVAEALAAAPTANAGGFFPAAPLPDAVEITFADATVATRYGDAAVVLEGSDYRTPVDFGDSAIGNAAQFGIDLPGGDVPVLNYSAFDSDEGLHIATPAGSGDLTSFTMVWDINSADTGSYQALLQLDAGNSSDADLFINGGRGIGISSTYTGTVPADDWARIAITVEDLGNGNSTLSKYIDGALVGTQTVPTARFTVDASTGFLILTDNDHETAQGYLAHFGMTDTVLTPAQIAALGGVDADGPFAEGEALVQIGFDGYAPTAEYGQGGVMLNDTVPVVITEPEVHGLLDQLVALSDEALIYDLSDVFGAGAHDFAVTNSNGEAVAATIEGGILTLDFQAYGLSDLTITAVNADGISVEDDLRIRVAGENAYTIAIFPDTQDYTSNPWIEQTFSAMTQWVADNAGSKNINFVANVGDVSQWSSTSQFDIASAAYQILRDAGINFSIVQGNHDIVNSAGDIRNTTNFNDAFSVSYMSEDPTFGGVYDAEPERYDNNYHLWTADDGSDWITINLEFGPRDDVLAWADQVLTEYSDRKAIISTHSYNNFNGRHDPLGADLEGEGAGYDYWLGDDPEGAWDGEEIWRDVISSHANVVFAVGGHIFGDGAETVVSYNDYGNKVYQFLLNYQDGVALEATEGGNGGNGAIRLITVDPDNDAIYTETYFAALDEYFTGYRGSEEASRDGLTGSYVGHQEEFYDAGITDRAAQAEAHAGADQEVTAGPEATTATVALSAAGSTDPNDDISSYTWTDEDGTVIATGAEASVDLGAGVHDLTLTVETTEGVTSTDEIRVIVKTDSTWLVETFNDGLAQGWVEAGSAPVAAPIAFGTDNGFGLPAIGDGDTAVASISALSNKQGLLVKPEMSGEVASYTLAYDIYVPAGQGNWTSLLQTDTNNGSDGEFFLRGNGSTAGIGISGNYQGEIAFDAWNRIVLTVSVEDGAQVVHKYVNGVLIGTQTLDSDITDGSRWSIDADTGFLLFSDEDGETSNLYVANFAFTPVVLDGTAVAALGGVDGNGMLSGDQPAGALQLTFDGALDATDVGTPQVDLLDLSGDSLLGDMQVIGSALADTTVGAPEAALYDRSNTADNMVVWQGGDWNDLVLETTIRSMDDDTMGVAFNYDGEGAFYLLTLDNQSNTRQLLRVEGSSVTVLASEAGGYTFNDEQDLVVSKVDGRITVTLDGVALFGGAVFDADPLSGGTVGLYSSYQDGAIFDDVVVRAPELTADAGTAILAIDWNGDGVEMVSLNGTASILPNADVAANWTGRDVSAEGLSAEVEAQAGRNLYTLTLEGHESDTVTVDLATGDRLIAADRFDDGDAAGWTIIDTTEIAGNGTAAAGTANWQVIDGALTETSGAYSRELTWNGASNPDVWQQGWSPLGDGTYALHKGSYALWSGNTDLTDYAIRTEITAPEGAVGVLLNYVDENNYYKIELDARVNLFTLVKVVDNYESMIARGAMSYTPGETFTLQAQIVDGKISATIDGHDLFAYAVEDHDIASGATGVWSWGAAGASFDDIAIVDLSTEFQIELHGTNGNDRLVGTEADELIYSGAGRLDQVAGGEGADIFVFGAETANGVRETTRITDYQVGVDRLDLGGAEIEDFRVAGHNLTLWVGEDRDQIVLAGVTAVDDLIFA